jgi:hypothetical protein
MLCMMVLALLCIAVKGSTLIESVHNTDVNITVPPYQCMHTIPDNGERQNDNTSTKSKGKGKKRASSTK